MIDFIAAKLKVPNENKTATRPGDKLRLFKSDGRLVGAGDFGRLLKDLLAKDEVYSGENLILEKTEDRELTDLGRYNFVVWTRNVTRGPGYDKGQSEKKFPNVISHFFMFLNLVNFEVLFFLVLFCRGKCHSLGPIVPKKKKKV